MSVTIPISLDTFLRPTSMTCIECEAPSVVYPSLKDERMGRLVCPNCSPALLGEFLLARLQAERAEHDLPVLTAEEAAPPPALSCGGVRRWLESLKQHTEGEGE